jgi:hypothetical protein
MADALTTEQIVYQVLQSIPLYNPVIMGLPFYLILLFFMGGALGFGALAFWQYVYEPMKPVWGFRTAALTNKPQSIVHGMNGQIWLEATEYVAGLFRSLNLPLMWIITAPVSGQMGKVSTLEMSDDWNIVHNIDIDYAIVEIIHLWNTDIMAKNPEKTQDDLVQEGQLIYDWNTFKVKLMDGTLDAFVPRGVKLPPFRIVDLHEVRRYLPKWTAAHFAGYINQEVAKRMKKKDDEGKELMKYAIIAAAAILIAGILVYLILQKT